MWSVIKAALVELLWPIVKDIVKKYSRELIEWLIAKLKEWADTLSLENATVAAKKAQENEAAAKRATTTAEAEKHEAVAKVWREVAEMFRKENDALSDQLLRIKAQAALEGDKVIDEMSFDDAITEKDGKLSMSDHQPRLPR